MAKENKENQETVVETELNEESTETVEAEVQEQPEEKSELEKAQESIANLTDRLMRTAAEFDNFKKRSIREKDEVYGTAVCDTIAKILPVLDNLDRAVQYNTEDSAQTPLGKGLELTLKSFQELLQKLGVSEIEALGKQFDPNVHNAVMHVDDENFGENEIVEVFMKGYAKGDKVLRYSMVKVAN